MRLTNNSNLPQPIFDAIKRARDSYDGGDSDTSVTRLVAPPRMVELKRLFDDELAEDAADAVYALLGTAVHRLFEEANEEAIVERRFFADMAGWRVSGQFDVLFPTSGLLADYKMVKVSELQHGLKKEKEEQLNYLAHLCRVNGYEINKVEAHVILRDWSKVQAAGDPSYPQKQIALVPVTLWAPDFARIHMERRIQVHQQAREVLPECTDEERWARPTRWAAMKRGNTRASKVEDTEAAAYAYISGKAGYFVEERPGSNMRCELYCDAAPVCRQWAELRAK